MRPDTAAATVDVEVVSTDYEIRSMLREACLRAGYRASDSPTFQSPSDLAVWDVPVLETRWTEQLERRSRGGPVVALLGFADRAAVSAAREAGASACLDFPCAIDDLIHVLDRLASEATPPTRGDSLARAQLPHAAHAPHAIRPRRGRTTPAAGLLWPRPAAAPRIPPGPAN
jgi:DNA-binding NarL/FixJ family response regulator